MWIIDPRERTMSVYFKRGGDVIWLAVQKQYHSEALGIALPLSEIFG